MKKAKTTHCYFCLKESPWFNSAEGISLDSDDGLTELRLVPNKDVPGKFIASIINKQNGKSIISAECDAYWSSLELLVNKAYKEHVMVILYYPSGSVRPLSI